MPSTRFSTTRRWAGRLWWFVDASRRTLLNLLFLLIVLALLFAIFRSGPPALEDKTALVLKLRGPIVEQRAGGTRDNALSQLRGDDVQSVRLRDVLQGLDVAAKDPKITSLVLLTDDLQAAGLPMLREVGAAIDRFKASGKPVVAWASGYDQRQYYLAARASEVLMHPQGMVYLDGFGRARNYYRDAFDKLGVEVQLLRVGTFKSAAEPFIANGPSPAATEAENFLYSALWATYLEGVETARKFKPGSVMAYIDESPQRLAAVGGDSGQLALASKLVDGLKTRNDLRALMIERGAKDKEGKTFRQVDFNDYLARNRPKAQGDAVGVVIAEGEIIDGTAAPGTVGGLSTAELIRKARDDEAIKALVLRVNSPGGAVFGSELVRHELELTRAAGKPVVVSMGNLAASGGYWISTASDEVIADAATITGSIGVFALLPNGAKALDKLGVHAAGTSTTWLGNAGDPRLPPNPRFLALIQASIDHVYVDFTSKVAAARKTTPEKIDAVAQGRVWTGAQAKERGLVDRLGSYGDALASAAKRGKLADGYRVAYIEGEPGKLERVLEAFGASVAGSIVAQLPASWQAGLLGAPAPLAHVQRELGWLAGLAAPEARAAGKPFVALTHCLCEP